jgi:hypothetical protein
MERFVHRLVSAASLLLCMAIAALWVSGSRDWTRLAALPNRCEVWLDWSGPGALSIGFFQRRPFPPEMPALNDPGAKAWYGRFFALRRWRICGFGFASGNDAVWGSGGPKLGVYHAGYWFWVPDWAAVMLTAILPAFLWSRYWRAYRQSRRRRSRLCAACG